MAGKRIAFDYLQYLENSKNSYKSFYRTSNIIDTHDDVDNFDDSYSENRTPFDFGYDETCRLIMNESKKRRSKRRLFSRWQKIKKIV